MATQKDRFPGKYLANAQLYVSIAAYTKVPKSWNEDNYTTDFSEILH